MKTAKKPVAYVPVGSPGLYSAVTPVAPERGSAHGGVTTSSVKPVVPGSKVAMTARVNGVLIQIN